MHKILIAIFLLTTSISFAQDWTINFDEAKTLATNQNKNIILVFSGSDWCAPCIKLDKTIWQSEAFRIKAAADWVLVKADFPKKKANALTEDQKKHNDALADKYNKEGYFPLVLVLDKTGKVLGKTGFKNIAPTEFIALLQSFEENK